MARLCSSCGFPMKSRMVHPCEKSEKNIDYATDEKDKDKDKTEKKKIAIFTCPNGHEDIYRKGDEDKKWKGIKGKDKRKEVDTLNP